MQQASPSARWLPLRLLPFVLLLLFSNSQARHLVGDTLLQLFPAASCTPHCQPQTTPPANPLPSVAVWVNPSSNLVETPATALKPAARAVNTSETEIGFQVRTRPSPWPRGPPQLG